MRRGDSILSKLDWVTVLLFFLIVIMGWLNIFAAVYDESTNPSIFDLSLNSGRQLMFIATSFILIITIMVIDFKFFDTFGYFIFGGIIFLLIFVLLFGREVAGSKSWFEIGAFRLQPSEFAKFATALAVAKFIGDTNFRMDRIKNQALLFGIIGLPAILIILQGDTGTALVYSVFLLVFFREGMSPILLLLGTAAAIIFILTLLVSNHLYLYGGIAIIAAVIIIFGKKSIRNIALTLAGAIVIAGVIRSVDYVITDVLKPHQQNRIKALINPDADPLGYGWNVTQSKIAIGSGQFFGRGYLNGTQTKYDFVPEQSTDFIFCTIAEEHGWLGSFVIIGLFVTFLLRIIFIAERQKWRFARVYGYGVACIIFFHFAVNIGMTIGLFPVIGIPLPMFSYGGSSLWAFTILIFILIKLDAHRMQVLVR
ncbi:rod shape-determining protein RodA [Fulvivirga sp. RKSG066]|uniref:rod shape-determining protein RodA n=1 Tax=Fulvivirga aurantia TaxID=2529383 RepID=UPI0012BC2560|nr:rod shape-determining protein RodA [Fulvivirga aurantia]MTI21015.1 rod shape-determining protein RodA [Fulvivirga aurantia]